MAVIPLTLTISLCLVFTFVVFFLRERARQRFDSAESLALLPLADETPVQTLSSTAADKSGSNDLSRS
jgi:cbb3-type cytochrome oxidase subunit 3